MAFTTGCVTFPNWVTTEGSFAQPSVTELGGMTALSRRGWKQIFQQQDTAGFLSLRSISSGSFNIFCARDSLKHKSKQKH